MEIGRNSSGNVVISEEVIAKIAKVAATDIPGVAGVVAKPADIKSIFRLGKLMRPVSVIFKDNQFVIDIFIKAKEGFNVAELARKVQDSVKEAVQNMTGTVVYKVNVNICEVELNKASHK